MKKLRRWFLSIFILLTIALAAPVIAFDVFWLKPRIDQITAMAAAGTSGELYPTSLISKMVTTSEPNGLNWSVGRIIIHQSKPEFEAHGKLHWHVVGLLTPLLLRLHLTESELLSIYCARVYVGKSSYGLSAISRRLFGKNLTDLTIEEAATVAAWPRAPSYFSKYPSGLEVRRDAILKGFGGGI